MSGWQLAWLLWALAFAVIEAAALIRRAPGDTLSEQVWSLFMPSRGERFWRFRRFVLLAFMAWLVAHFVTAGAF